jgi:hypothetical protein
MRKHEREEIKAVGESPESLILRLIDSVEENQLRQKPQLNKKPEEKVELNRKEDWKTRQSRIRKKYE